MTEKQINEWRDEIETHLNGLITTITPGITKIEINWRFSAFVADKYSSNPREVRSVDVWLYSRGNKRKRRTVEIETDDPYQLVIELLKSIKPTKGGII